MSTAFEFITIRYSNSCDIGNIIFQDNFTFELNLIGVLGEPKYEHIERVTENENKEVEYNSRTLKKSLTLITTGNEQLLDVLNFIRICDSKILYNKVGEAYIINEMKVEGDLANGINVIKVEFVLFIVTNKACCTNNIINDNLDNYIEVLDLFTTSSEKYINNNSVQIGSLYAINISSKYYIIIRSNEQNDGSLVAGWNYYEVTQNVVYKLLTLNMIAEKLLTSTHIAEVVTIPYLKSYTLVTGSTYIIEGQCKQGYVVGFEKKPSGGSYSNMNINSTSYNYTTSENFTGSGVEATLNNGDKVRAYISTIADPTTALYYSNELRIII